MFILLYTRDGRTYRHPLRPGDTIVGRAPVCDLPIDDASISRRHARFRVHGDHCVLTDLGGRNGTFLNGEPVTEAGLKAGDAVVLGRFPMRVDHAAVQPVVFSDTHSIADTGLSIVRPLVDRHVGTPAQTVAVTSDRLLELIDDVARRLTRCTSVSELLERIITVALDRIPADRAFLLLVDERGEIVPKVIRARNNRPIASATLSRPLVRRIIVERAAILGWDANVASDAVYGQRLESENLRSFICAPLMTDKQQATGLLYLDSPESAPLSAADLDLLQAFGSYAGAAIEHAQSNSRALDELRLRERLHRHHSTAMVERLLDQAGAPSSRHSTVEIEERDVTVLIADIVDFMRRAKAMSPRGTAQLLDTCLSLMSDAVFAEDGTLDKFDREAIIAVFGAPMTQLDHADRAVRAAEAMREAISRLPVEVPVVLRIAVNSGRAIVGEIGSSTRRDYTVVGDVVHACWAMLATTCRPGEIAIGDATRARLQQNQNE